jgi:acetyl/propionyl-CoA carboxylase alpha subunit
MFQKLLVANCGEIACQVTRAADKMGIANTAIYLDANSSASRLRLVVE